MITFGEVVMGKTDFTKVEEALTEGLRKMEVDKLLSIADENSEAKGKTDKKLSPAQSQLLAILKHELKQMNLSYDEICDKLKIDKKELKRLLKDTEALVAADWDQLNQLKARMTTIKEEQEKKAAKPSDDILIEQQRKSQKTKRFNVNDKWLPLK